MSSSIKGLGWRTWYTVFGLVYVVWVVYLGLDNFNKVYSEYRWTQKQLVPQQIEKIALQELTEKCRKKAKRLRRDRRTAEEVPTGVLEDTCGSFPDQVLEERKTVVTKNLVVENKRFQRKIVVFYVSFGIFFLVLPLVFIYQLLRFFIWLFRDLKFIK